MNKADIEALAKAYESGEMSEFDFYQQQALSKVHELTDFKIEGVLTIGAAFLGFAVLGFPGAIALGLMGAQSVVNKVSKGMKAAADIDAGNIAPYLPPDERPYFERLVQTKAPELPAAVAAVEGNQPTTPTTATAPGQAQQPTITLNINGQSVTPSEPPQTQERIQEQESPQAQEQTIDPAPVATTPTTEQQQQQHPPGLEELNLNLLRNASLVLIFGSQGSGKTTFAKGVCGLRAADGHKVTALDPHGSQQFWHPWQVVGSGRDYDAIAAYMEVFDAEVTARYQEVSKGRTQFTPDTTLCEELTQWAEHVESAPAFIKSCCSDIRKIKRHVVLVSHSDTLTGICKASGMRQALNDNAIKINLLSEIDKNSGEYRPTGEAILHLPGEKPQKVLVPDMRCFLNSNLSDKLYKLGDSGDGSSPGSVHGSDPSVQPFERLNGREHVAEPRSNGFEPNPNGAEPNPEPTLNGTPNGGFQAQSFLSERDRAHLMNAKGMSRDEIIFQIWGVKKGGSPKYASGKEKLSNWLGI